MWSYISHIGFSNLVYFIVFIVLSFIKWHSKSIHQIEVKVALISTWLGLCGIDLTQVSYYLAIQAYTCATLGKLHDQVLIFIGFSLAIQEELLNFLILEVKEISARNYEANLYLKVVWNSLKHSILSTKFLSVFGVDFEHDLVWVNCGI